MVGACSRVGGGVVGPGQDPLHARLVGEGRGPGSPVLQTLVHALGPNIGLGGKQDTGHFWSEERKYRKIVSFVLLKPFTYFLERLHVSSFHISSDIPLHLFPTRKQNNIHNSYSYHSTNKLV